MKRFLRMSYLAAGIGGIGFFAMSVLLLGVWPGRMLEHQIHSTAPAHPLPLTASEQRGRAIYGRDGCAYCHTQQIRYVDRDVKRFGAATLAWETIFDYPHLWGTRRIGPVLSREASVRSADWQLTHLYSPRKVVGDSVMPAFPWLFDGAPDRPKQEARDVLAYLDTLGRNRELAGPEGEAHARAACECSDDEKRLAFDSPQLNASPAMTRRTGDYPKLAASREGTRGLQLYARNCASCHGPRGEGNGPGAAGLLPHPTNLKEHEYTLDRLSFVLWNGVAGTAMPAWRDLPVQDLSEVAQVVRGFHPGQGEVPLPQDAIESGRQVFASHCMQCHGENGGGDGPAVNRFPIAATNFHEQRPSRVSGLESIRNGVEGTPMAPWTGELSDAEMVAASSFVRGLFQAGAAGGGR
jgi:cbb3-type cytochrome oxidase cytochrome c subunit/mono/diheme cytochrome c family protein